MSASEPLIQHRVADRFDGLSPQLQRAARYVAEHPEEVATRSLRRVADAAKVAPQTMSRLARALDFNGYEDLRDICRAQFRNPTIRFSDRAGALQDGKAHGERAQNAFLFAQSEASVANIQQLLNTTDLSALRASVDRLSKARKVIVVATMGAGGIGEYLDYVSAFAFDNWSHPTTPAAWARAIIGLGKDDAVIVITQAPYATQSVERARQARQLGAYVMSITDAIGSPVIPASSASFIVPSESPQFFPSYVATLLFIESIMGMLVRRGGPAVKKRVAAAETANASWGDYWHT